MDDTNVVAARLGLPFVCGVCTKVHEKADLRDRDVCTCFSKAWELVLGYKELWFSPSGELLISKPTCEFEGSKYFNVPKISYSYPIENDVFMLSFPMKTIKKILSKKYNDWKEDCIRQAVGLIEERGQLKNVRVRDGILVINEREHKFITYTLALLMMKCQEAAKAFSSIGPYPILDVEWKSLKESAKVLVAISREYTLFASERTRVVHVPNGIKSVREAENFLLGSQPAR